MRAPCRRLTRYSQVSFIEHQRSTFKSIFRPHFRVDIKHSIIIQQTEKKINVFCRFIRNRTVCLDACSKKAAQSEQLLYFVGITFTVISCPPFPAGKFCLFQNCRPQTPFQVGNGWGLFKINSLFKNFLGFKGCIWLFPVGISERTF